MARKNGKAGLSPRSLLFFAPFFFSPFRLSLPRLSAPGSLRMGYFGCQSFFRTRHAILKSEIIQKIEVTHKRNLWPERAMAVYALRLGH